MSRLIESIRLENGQFSRLSFHQERMSRSGKEVFGLAEPWKLEEILSAHSIPEKGLFKCRVLYNKLEVFVEFVPYTITPTVTLKTIRENNIRYPHKLEDRNELRKLWEMRGDCDDVLIIRNGLVTDTSYANIVFREKDQWVTPKSYLLAGTMRQFLLGTNIIIEREIKEEDVHRFTSFKLINALLDWNNPSYDVSNIH